MIRYYVLNHLFLYLFSTRKEQIRTVSVSLIHFGRQAPGCVLQLYHGACVQQTDYTLVHAPNRSASEVVRSQEGQHSQPLNGVYLMVMLCKCKICTNCCERNIVLECCHSKSGDSIHSKKDVHPVVNRSGYMQGMEKEFSFLVMQEFSN